ncbi:hypothetical protein AOLI_G00315240 [Acnodon oligacanthus]
MLGPRRKSTPSPRGLGGAAWWLYSVDSSFPVAYQWCCLSGNCSQTGRRQKAGEHTDSKLEHHGPTSLPHVREASSGEVGVDDALDQIASSA